MLSWLADWLEQIIAVVLLAGFIDLLLPNKAMQRYVRLVAGMLILLTILSPIVRLLQGDFGTKLDESMDNWLQGTASAPELKMPTLQDIQREAQSLRRKEQASAAVLAERKLAEAMHEQIGKRTGLSVEAVTVKLDDSGAKAPGVKAVTVTLAARPGGESGGSEALPPGAAGQDASGETSGADGVEPVKPVTVNVAADSASEEGGDAAGAGSGEYAPAPERAAVAVKKVLSDGWAIDPGIVAVRQSGSDGGAGQ